MSKAAAVPQSESVLGVFYAALDTQGTALLLHRDRPDCWWNIRQINSQSGRPTHSFNAYNIQLAKTETDRQTYGHKYNERQTLVDSECGPAALSVYLSICLSV